MIIYLRFSLPTPTWKNWPKIKKKQKKHYFMTFSIDLKMGIQKWILKFFLGGNYMYPNANWFL
jgi:hypothetical protein